MKTGKVILGIAGLIVLLFIARLAFVAIVLKSTIKAANKLQTEPERFTDLQGKTNQLKNPESLRKRNTQNIQGVSNEGKLNPNVRF